MTAREARNLYQREWRAKNKDKVRQYNERRWEKRAAQLNEEKPSEEKPDDS